MLSPRRRSPATRSPATRRRSPASSTCHSGRRMWAPISTPTSTTRPSLTCSVESLQRWRWRGHRRPGDDEHADRDQRPDPEPPRGGAQRAPSRSPPRSTGTTTAREHQLAADEERHREQVQPQDAVPERHRRRSCQTPRADELRPRRRRCRPARAARAGRAAPATATAASGPSARSRERSAALAGTLARARRRPRATS